jgi:diguanylate cyclase (GGDEF)-like protein/PAS domain S-box-containing protein
VSAGTEGERWLGTGPVRRIFDSINDGVLIVAADTHAFLDVNARVCELFGYTRIELLALDIDRLAADMTPAAQSELAALRARAATGEVVTFEWCCRSKAGEAIWLEITARPLALEGRDAFLLTVHDIADRRKARALQAYGDRIIHGIALSIAGLVVDSAFPVAMMGVLAALGEAMDLDRISVIERLGPHATRPESTAFAWHREGLSDIDSTTVVQPEDRAAFTAWRAPLLEDKPVVAYADSATGFVGRVMNAGGAQSAVLLPIRVGEAYWGYLVAESCSAVRRWTQAESASLGVFAQVIGALMSRRETWMALDKSEAKFRTVSDMMFDGMVMIGVDGRITYWNRGAERIFGYSATEAVGRRTQEWLHFDVLRERAAQGMEQLLATGHAAMLDSTLEMAAVRKDEVEITIELSVSAMALGPDRFVVVIVRDVSERKRATALIERMANYDGLTGLPNRQSFLATLAGAIAHVKRSKRCLAVLYMDLDRFKDINDTLGHPTGDRLLESVAERLRSSVREVDTVARFGGDEFAAVAVDIREPADAALLAAKLVKEIGAPFLIGEREVHSGTSVGIAVFGPDSPDAEALLAHADVALYRAKREGGGAYRFYTQSLDAEVRERVALDTEISAGILARQFFLVYQPQVDLETGRIAGIEALLRWQHPLRGVIGPAAFVNAAERSGAIVALGRFVYGEACRQMRCWEEAGIAPPLIGVNVSVIQFKFAIDFEDGIAVALVQSGLAPARLELELTESVLMGASIEHNDALLRLRRSGLRIAIDDFGTGYSSLDYLRRFHVDRIKIPQNFIFDLCNDPGVGAIVRATLGLARELAIDVVVEGVETAEQLALLRAWGCRCVQGFYFSRPLGVDDATALLRIGRVDPARPLALAP